jgi:hypothetical protein
MVLETLQQKQENKRQLIVVRVKEQLEIKKFGYLIFKLASGLSRATVGAVTQFIFEN